MIKHNVKLAACGTRFPWRFRSLLLLIPLLLSVVRASRAALSGGLGVSGAMGDLQTIILFSGVVITAAVLLFDYVWQD